MYDVHQMDMKADHTDKMPLAIPSKNAPDKVLMSPPLQI